MPEYLAPGVYVEEVDTGPKPIEGVSTSTAGFVGMTARGPSVGLPVLVTSFSDFQRKFGGYFDLSKLDPGFKGHTYLPFAVEGFFANGGKRLFVLRAVPTSAVVAQATAQGGLVTRLKPGENAVVGQNMLKLATLRGIQDGTLLRLRMIKDGITYESADLTIDTNGVNRLTNEVTVTANITIAPSFAGSPTEFDARRTAVLTDVETLQTAPANAVGLIGNLAATTSVRPNTFVIKAKDAGAWGNAILIQVTHETAARTELDTSVPTDGLINGADDDNRIAVKSTAGFYIGAWVEIDNGVRKRYRKVLNVQGLVVTLDEDSLAGLAGADAIQPQAPATTTVISVCEFRLVASYGGVTEQFGGLTMENVAGKYYVDVINSASNLIQIDTTALPAATYPFMFPSAPDGITIVLATGTDGTAPPTDMDYRGTDGGPGLRSGLKALEDIDQVSIIAAPGITSQTVQSALIEQCERLKDRFAILDPKPKTNDVAPDLNDIQAQRQLFDTKYAALYYPRLIATDPVSGNVMPIPPSGHIAGIYARVDIERGVHKAPANEVVRNIAGLELKVNKGEQEILNPSPLNINVIRDLRDDSRGFRVWGARCITSDAAWKYVPVRRLFIFMEESLDEGTQWVVFEPNDERLWARVRQSVSNFLTRVWRDGALMGATPEEAFFVRVDLTTMTQDDIDNGRLIMEIGVAPVKPAEFVIIRIGQKVGGAEVTEL